MVPAIYFVRLIRPSANQLYRGDFLLIRRQLVPFDESLPGGSASDLVSPDV